MNFPSIKLQLHGTIKEHIKHTQDLKTYIKITINEDNKNKKNNKNCIKKLKKMKDSKDTQAKSERK